MKYSCDGMSLLKPICVEIGTRKQANISLLCLLAWVMITKDPVDKLAQLANLCFQLLKCFSLRRDTDFNLWWFELLVQTTCELKILLCLASKNFWMWSLRRFFKCEPLQVVGVHGQLLQLHDSRQGSSLYLHQGRTSERQPPQPDQTQEHRSRTHTAGGWEGRGNCTTPPKKCMRTKSNPPSSLYLYGLSSRLSCSRAPSSPNQSWLRAVSWLSDRSSSSKLHRESNADGWITASLLPAGQEIPSYVYQNVTK